MTACRSTTARGAPVPSSDGCDPLTDETLRLTRALQLLMVAVGHVRSVVADDLAVATNDSMALQILDVLGPMPQIELGRRLRLTSSSITALVDRLESAGYAERRPDPGDRRRSIVVMTERATDTMTGARETLGAHLVAELVADEDLPHALERLAEGLGGIETIRS